MPNSAAVRRAFSIRPLQTAVIGAPMARKAGACEERANPVPINPMPISFNQFSFPNGRFSIGTGSTGSASGKPKTRE
jgi:hypothetical protein